MENLDLFSPLPEGESFTAIVTHRSKTKSGHPRVYLYTENEDLLLAGECYGVGHTKFRIATGSSNFDKVGNPGYLASVERSVIQRTWYVNLEKDGASKLVLKVRYLLRKEKESRDRVMIVMLMNPGGDVQEQLHQQEFAPFFAEKFPDLPEPPANPQRNFFLTAGEDKHAFSFAEISDDEYRFCVSGPLSIFLAFCIAVTIFYPIDAEE